MNYTGSSRGPEYLTFGKERSPSCLISNHLYSKNSFSFLDMEVVLCGEGPVSMVLNLSQIVQVLHVRQVLNLGGLHLTFNLRNFKCYQKQLQYVLKSFCGALTN